MVTIKKAKVEVKASGMEIPLRMRVLATEFRFVDDAIRSIRELGDKVKELIRLQKDLEKQVASNVKAMFLEVRLPSVKTSPTISDKSETVEIPNRKSLEKNLSVVRELWETREALDAMEAKIRTAFSSMEQGSPDRALREVALLKKQIDKSLSDAFVFIGTLARDHMPQQLETFVEQIKRVLEKSVAYEDSTVYSYVHTVNGDLVFSQYVQLKHVTDEDGQLFQNMYVVLSYRASVTTEAGLYITVLSDFVPPSARLLTRKVDSVKKAVQSLNMLFSLDNFTNSIGSIPLNLMLKERNITKELFEYQQYVKSIEVQEEQIVFTLKPEIQDRDLAHKISTQVFHELKAVVSSKNARLRMTVKKGKVCYYLLFFFVNPSNLPLVMRDDLNFLQDRFRLNDQAMDRIVKTINEGSEGN